MNNFEIYKSSDNQIELQVNLENDTVWLTQEQMSLLFSKSKATINEHILNIFKEKELDKKAVVRKIGISDFSTKPTNFYNLDAIISVGYRVKSQQGTQFRIWASQRLKDYLVKGYSLNEKRLAQLSQNMQQLKNTVELIQKATDNQELKLTEAKGLLQIIGQYTQSFVLLNQFDSNTIEQKELNVNITYEINYSEAKAAIATLKQQLKEKKEATDFFGNEKDESFQGTLKSVVQTFGGEYVYPSIEEQAAHLLYFIIKNHPFTDGNKRIGAFLFIWFLEKNKHRFKQSGELKINDNALVALALLVAQSDPAEKELMIKLITQLIVN